MPEPPRRGWPEQSNGGRRDCAQPTQPDAQRTHRALGRIGLQHPILPPDLENRPRQRSTQAQPEHKHERTQTLRNGRGGRPPTGSDRCATTTTAPHSSHTAEIVRANLPTCTTTGPPRQLCYDNATAACEPIVLCFPHCARPMPLPGATANRMSVLCGLVQSLGFGGPARSGCVGI